MADDVHTSSESSVTNLVSGILNDAQELFKQQVVLLKHEVKDDLRKTRDAALVLVIGTGVVSLGGLLLCWGLVHLLSWAAGEEHLPLWASFGIVGGILAIVGGIVCYLGKKKFDSFNPLPEETAEALKENVQWIMKPK
jgi:multisubunit Na+/H+ antiporter MnhB subunit